MTIRTPIMNAILQSQLDRVETALNTLIDSITSYNPSIPAAIDLLSADEELTNGLEQRKPTFYTSSPPYPSCRNPCITNAYHLPPLQ